MAGPSAVQSLVLRLQAMLLSSDVTADVALDRAAWTILAGVGPLVGALMVAGSLAVLVQSGFLLHPGALQPDLARLDPRRGLGRLFGPDNLIEGLKALAKLAVLAGCLWTVGRAAWADTRVALLFQPDTLGRHVGRALAALLMLVAACQVGIALLDMAWTRWRFAARMRMSREEVKQEQKEAEGDPRVKARLRQLRQARARRRMLAAVPKATVVITNPTHYAVALAYDRTQASAPRVVAKGMDEVAARIRDTARRAGVPLVANPPLARALHEVPLDREVPAEHFRAVAEIVAYVWRLKGLAPAR